MPDYPTYTDEALFQLLQNSDELAFTEIYQRYYHVLYHYISSFVKMPSLTEDLVQEVMMKIWEMRKYAHIKTSFRSYIYRISHNKTMDALKKIVSDETLRTEAIQWMHTTLEEDTVEGTLAHYEQLLGEAVATLPPQRRKVFLLCRQNDKTYNQVAAELGISRNTVKEHMVLALRFLRNYFLDKGELLTLFLLLGKFL